MITAELPRKAEGGGLHVNNKERVDGLNSQHIIMLFFIQNQTEKTRISN